jgi:GTP cyclohydrolase II
LQEEGVDTLDANLALGFAADERDFGVAAAMLQALEVDAVTLLSNNPDKKAQLSRYGVKVAAQVPLQATPTEENIEYLNTKRERFGHLT